ncbi:sugar ABC transporter ATP-binding protein [Moorella naiadis]|uniref:sugar ABC transporter ATP-binding protein n=1 Tax=Moorella naiadis (nom. illeg.) TaxID=3093670 RepID=UPI003D9CB641
MPQMILEMRQITKSYPGVQALNKVDFVLYAGEVHALVGENGAGKSTLMKILAGAVPRDAGEIKVKGEAVSTWDPREAQAQGIAIIYQERNLIPYLNVAQNIFLGREPGAKGLVDFPRLYRNARELIGKIGADINIHARVGKLTAAQQQMVEIAKALSMQAEIILMDEPTSSLSEREKEALFTLIRQLKDQGKAIIYISHRMEEIFEIADRITVLRDGEKIGTYLPAEIDKESLVRLMVGRAIKEDSYYQQIKVGAKVLEVKNLSRKGAFNNISFSLAAGEILGFAGLVGAGRSEMARVLFGVDKLDGGAIYFKGQRVKINASQDALKLGIGLVPEDRKEQGLILGMTVKENMTLALLREIAPLGVISRLRQLKFCQQYTARLNLKTPSFEQKVRNLSGGNQQKVVIAKWLAVNPAVLILDEPTRGIDVGAKSEIHNLIRQMAENGIAVMVISSELPELLQLCHRILIMREGELVGEVAREAASEELIMSYATGGKRDGGSSIVSSGRG